MRNMGRQAVLIAVLVLGVAACDGGQNVTLTQSGSASGPAPTQPGIQGNYTLEVQAASQCGWPVSTHRWPVVVVYDETPGGDIYFSDATYDNGDPNSALLLLNLMYSYSPPGGTSWSLRAMGDFGIRSADNYYVWMALSAGGNSAPTTASDGRPEILDVPLSGILTLIRERSWECSAGRVSLRVL